jgi:hypothetical protein
MSIVVARFAEPLQDGVLLGSNACQGVTPVTLAEFTLDPGSGLTYYDISLVDGYNMPLAIKLIQHGNSSLDAIPPSLTNPSCNASPGEVEPPNYNPYRSGEGEFLGTNSSDPLPLETRKSVGAIAQWCPWSLQATTNIAPIGGIFVYPDMSVNRPWFDPCYSACARHGDDADCCTGAYDSPSACTPSAYSKSAKAVCPDAYSYGKYYSIPVQSSFLIQASSLRRPDINIYRTFWCWFRDPILPRCSVHKYSRDFKERASPACTRQHSKQSQACKREALGSRLSGQP